MKKVFSIACTLCVMLFFSACDITPTPGNNTQLPEENDSSNGAKLNPEESKQQFVNYAQELLDKFKTADHKQFLQTIDYVAYKMEDYDWEESWNQVKPGIPVNVIQDVAHRAANGNMVKAANLTPETWSIVNINAIFEADDAQRIWRYVGESNGGIVIRCKNENNKWIKLTCTATGETLSFSNSFEVVNEDETIYHYYVEYYDDNYGYITNEITKSQYDRLNNGASNYNGYTYFWTYYNAEYVYDNLPFTVILPKHVDVSLTEDSKEQFAAKIDLDVQRNDHANVKMDLKLMNINYKFEQNISARNISQSMACSINNTNVFKYAINAPSCFLPKFPNNAITDNEDWELMEEDLEEYYSKLYEDGKIGKVTMVANFLNKVYCNASVKDGDNLRTKMEDLMNSELSESSKEFNKSLCDLINKNTETNICYNGEQNVQAKVMMEYLKDDYYEEEERYYSEPVIYFVSDGSSYAFWDYFTYEVFKPVLSSCQNLVNAYLDLATNHDFGHVDFIDE